MFRYDRLDELVKETGKKKNYLSEKIGFAGRYLNDAKKQNSDIKLEKVKILAYELGTTVEYLRGESSEKKPALPKEGELDSALVSRLVQLSPEEQEKVDAFVQGLIASR